MYRPPKCWKMAVRAQDKKDFQFFLIHAITEFASWYFFSNSELERAFLPPTLYAISMFHCLQIFFSGVFLIVRSPSLAKIWGFIPANSADTLISFEFFGCFEIMTLSTHASSSIIFFRSIAGIKTLPFFALSQLSLFKITTSVSPSFFASLKSARCPIWNGSMPPDTATIIPLFFSIRRKIIQSHSKLLAICLEHDPC